MKENELVVLQMLSKSVTIVLKGGGIMAKTANISLRIDPEVKKSVEELYANFGISVTDAINIFLHTSLMEGGFPFQPKQPRYNKETEAAIQETRNIIAGKSKTKSYATIEEFVDELGLE